jgi:hypothetical protein
MYTGAGCQGGGEHGMYAVPDARYSFSPARGRSMKQLRMQDMWPAKLFWMLQAGDGGWWVCFVISLVFQLLLIAALLRRFNRVVHR